VFAHSAEKQSFSSETQSDPIFLGVIIKNNNRLIPYFLKTLDRLDYDKSKLTLQMDLYNDTPEVKELLNTWINKSKNAYNHISLIEHDVPISCASVPNDQRFVLFSEIKNGYLTSTKNLGCSHCFILESDSFVKPFTLKQLIAQNKPIVAPLLRPVPEANDAFRNFFPDVTDRGYFNNHAIYAPIADRQAIGTFRVPVVSHVYLIQAKFIDRLNFSGETPEWEFVTFARNARANEIHQYICNEYEFGSLLHFKSGSTKKEKTVTLQGIDLEVTPKVLQNIFSNYYDEDPELKNYIANFNFEKYSIYPVGKDLYYVDDIYDWIKSLYIKKGIEWEKHIQCQLAAYGKPNSVALDIGGHMGTHTLNLSRIVGEQGVVHVFEPQKKMFSELNINMHLNGCKNIVFHRNALGNSEKWIQMCRPCSTNEGIACVNESPTALNSDMAKMIRLDSLDLNDVSIIKIDVEGFEMEVIRGGVETIKRNKPVMIVEIFQGPENAAKIKEIESLGYKHKLLHGDDYLFLPV